MLLLSKASKDDLFEEGFSVKSVEQRREILCKSSFSWEGLNENFNLNFLEKPKSVRNFAFKILFQSPFNRTSFRR